ncbi:hypothetical protein [Borreliella garinii]|uniref:hypothetical protein n=1 Tax=Borreliella garinii TaxID=29519 RepID=UPI0004D765F3|nr:hypothetical protein [Borreliella garinii]KEO61965.1 hypothetical protein DM10_04890 [Borreliella garinii]
MEKRRKEREKNKERRRKIAEDNSLEKITKNEINKAANKIDKIIGDIYNIKGKMKQLDRKLKTRLQAPYMMILVVLKAVMMLCVIYG